MMSFALKDNELRQDGKYIHYIPEKKEFPDQYHSKAG